MWLGFRNAKQKKHLRRKQSNGKHCLPLFLNYFAANSELSCKDIRKAEKQDYYFHGKRKLIGLLQEGERVQYRTTVPVLITLRLVICKVIFLVALVLCIFVPRPLVGSYGIFFLSNGLMTKSGSKCFVR